MSTLENQNTYVIDSSSFEKATDNFEDADKIARPSLTYWQDAFRRFKMNKIAVVACIVILVVCLLAIVVPMISPYTYSEQNILLLNKGPSSQHYFGTDDLGRDLFVRCFEGARVSLSIAFVTVFINVFLGIIYGGISGFIGGRVDNLMMRFCEIISSIPSMLWMMLLILILKPGITSIIIALCATGWVGVARLFRGQVLMLREMEYVQVSQTLGAKPMWIIFKHLLPNSMGPIITNIAFAIPGAIFAESSLSYFGLGIPMPYASLGALVSDGANKILLYPYQLLFPAMIICVIMLCFNLIGDGLRDALDPSLRSL